MTRAGIPGLHAVGDEAIVTGFEVDDRDLVGAQIPQGRHAGNDQPLAAGQKLLCLVDHVSFGLGVEHHLDLAARLRDSSHLGDS